tara:strand:+ start:473 stop:1159 length:687 start_codon:yes stop_codon:yes gene_type:complete
MAKGSFKQIDLLRKRREANSIEPYFLDTKKYIKKGIFSGLTLIALALIFGIPFIFRTKFLENEKSKIKIFSDEYDLLQKKLNKESKELKEISQFNNDLKNSMINISSSSALFQEIALIIPKDIQLLEFTSENNDLSMKATLSNDNYLRTINSFLLNLDKSELVSFDDIDLKKINTKEKETKNMSFFFEIKTKISTNFKLINEKYLMKLGSYGLLNRINILKNLETSLD